MADSDQLRERLAESRKLNPNCGCEQRGSRMFRCSYHEGFEDGWEAWQASARETQPARKTLNPDELANSLMSLVLDGGFTYPRDRERVRKQMAFIIRRCARETVNPAKEKR